MKRPWPSKIPGCGGQMKKEETVRTNLARYLSPQIVDQIIE
jgi:hypothetical protein